MDAMKVALMGLGSAGRQVADALLASSWCELTAVASRMSNRLERFRSAHPEIAAYDDFRSLIVENALDALFVAVPPFLRGPYLTLAAERGVPVWMLTPAAQRLDEALAWLARFERADCPIAVSRIWNIEPALADDAVGTKRVGRLFFARGHVMACLPDDLDWRGDAARAGGGVLLDCGYPLMDTIVQAMGLPGTVFMAAAGVSRPQTRFPYDTEDTASLICQFTGGAMAVVSACWTSGPSRWSLEWHGTEGSVHVDEHEVAVVDRAGSVERSRQGRAVNPFAPQVEDFLAGLRTHRRGIRSTLRQHLGTMAVLQAAYLSARTGERESPGDLFRVHHIEPQRPEGT